MYKINDNYPELTLEIGKMYKPIVSHTLVTPGILENGAKVWFGVGSILGGEIFLVLGKRDMNSQDPQRIKDVEEIIYTILYKDKVANLRVKKHLPNGVSWHYVLVSET